MHGPMDGSPDNDGIERRLREITAELAGPAKFKEPSAAERTSKPVQATQRMSWRNRRKAKRLRQPVRESRPTRPANSRRTGPAPS
ncbi:MAG TPA: hypothetical protein VGS19_14010 [Streptosporangiaceae bacterium]|nr:hypothetical protein [Streptosporangiaceae bacterium]